MKKFALGVVTVIAAAVLCVYVVLRTGVIPAGADATPTWIETWAAKMLLHATLNREAPTGPNPVALNDANLIVGSRREVFTTTSSKMSGSGSNS